MLSLILLSVAAAAYVAGGIAMKYADALHRLAPSLAVFLAFGIGAALQTVAMRSQSLGVGYVLVLGLEAVLAVVAGICIFDEKFLWQQALGMVLVVAGIILLKVGT